MISTSIGIATAPSASAVRYYQPQGFYVTSVSAGENNASAVIAAATTVNSYYVTLTAAPGTGKNFTFDIMKNGIAQSKTLTIADTATQGSLTSIGLSFAAGDTISFSCTPSGTPTVNPLKIGIEFSGTGQNLFSGDASTSTSATLNYYVGLHAGVANNAGTTPGVGSIVPTGGTISNLYTKITTAPGAAKSYAITLVVNGSPTALTCTISGAGVTTSNDTTHSVSVNPGDECYWQVVPSGTPSTGTMAISAQFTPTTDGESIYTFADGSTTLATGTTANYWGVGTAAASFQSTIEANREGTIGTVGVLKKLYVKLSTAPTTGKSYTFKVRSNGADAGPSVTISDTATTGNDTTNVSSNTTVNTNVGWSSVGTGTPTAAIVGTGFVLYVAPATGGGDLELMLMGMGSF